MKITIYTITECQFSKQEKEYLASHSLQFEEKNLETNREFLSEMLAISNNFAGTPVTKIEKDNKEIVVLKGFTKEELDKELGITVGSNDQAVTPPVATEAPTTAAPVSEQPVALTPAVAETPVPVEPAVTTPAAPVIEMPPVDMAVEPTQTAPAATVPTPQVEVPAPTQPSAPAQPAQDPALDSILNNLQSKVNEAPAPAAFATSNQTPPTIADSNLGKN